jgi:hypothetical protein
MSAVAMPAMDAGFGRSVAAISLVGMAIAVTVLLGRASLDTNIERACTVGDTPYLDFCPALSSQPQRAEALRSEISANPGDSWAYVRLAFADKANSSGLLDAAARLAPSNATVTAMQAAQALEQQDFPTAIAPLVSLVEHGYNDKAALVLARLIVSGRWQLLADYVKPGTHWFERVLAQMPSAQGPFSSALPLVVLSLDRGVLTPTELMPYVRLLRTSGAWNDAYSLWVALHKGKSPTIYNAGFVQPFEEDGFDWEATAQRPIGRAGAIIGRGSDETRGPLLEIRFTGRPFAVPLIRQHLFLGPGRYRLHGDYKTVQLRMEQGLAWTVRCTATPTEAGRSQSLNDTSNTWHRFEFVFSVPPRCGWVASLQLEAFAPLDATLGSRGHASFDALALEKLEP